MFHYTEKEYIFFFRYKILFKPVDYNDKSSPNSNIIWYRLDFSGLEFSKIEYFSQS